MPGSARAMARWAAVHSGHVSRLGAFALLAGLACSSKAPTDRQLISTSSTTSSTGADTATSSGASAGGAASATLTSGVPIHGATSVGGTGFIDLQATGAGGSMMMEETCGDEAYQAMLKPLAMHLLVDQSISMTEFDDRWTPVSTAIQTFVSDPGSAGMQVGLAYFPYWTTQTSLKCDPVSYETPDVAIGLLPGNAAQVTTSLMGKMFPCCGERPAERGSTPTRPAYEGSINYLASWLAQTPDHVGVLVLVTDGEPTDCQNNGIQDSVDLITRAASGTPPIPTYVVGIGNVANLDQFAAAGNTGLGPFIVDGTGVNTQTEFLAAMQAIRGAALPCVFDVPTPTSGDFDTNKVNVDYDPGNGAPPTPLYQVTDMTACASAGGGWYYDDPTAPSTINLCETTCSSVTAVETGSVSVTLGCTTRIK